MNLRHPRHCLNHLLTFTFISHFSDVTPNLEFKVIGANLSVHGITAVIPQMMLFRCIVPHQNINTASLKIGQTGATLASSVRLTVARIPTSPCFSLNNSCKPIRAISGSSSANSFHLMRRSLTNKSEHNITLLILASATGLVHISLP